MLTIGQSAATLSLVWRGSLQEKLCEARAGIDVVFFAAPFAARHDLCTGFTPHTFFAWFGLYRETLVFLIAFLRPKSVQKTESLPFGQDMRCCSAQAGCASQSAIKN
jgi:hypothetical protein